MLPDESLYLEDEELAEETEQIAGELDIDPIQALRTRDDFDGEYRDTVDFINEKARPKRVRERRNVRYTARKGKELPDWLRDPSKLPKKPPKKERT